MTDAARRTAELDDHPTTRAVRARRATPPEPLTLERIREIAREAGADDVGVVSIDDPAMIEERAYVERALPGVRTLIPIVVRMHPDDVRSPSRSVANLEFHRTGHEVDSIARDIAVALSAAGYTSINPAMAFPMEMDAFPERSFIVSHKKVAEAAGLGVMGIHRNVIHPRFGSFILLGTVLTTAEVRGRSSKLEFESVPLVQALRGRLPGRRHRAGRRLPLLGLLHAQLPRVHERLHGLHGGGRGQP
ncbi:MAG: hypothetical protein QM820_47465 [Minicystis sp.]